ncbi:MAG: DMT family transporter [Clostridia bacterium]
MAEKKRIWAHIIAVLTIIVWGSTYIASKVMLDTFTPLQLMTMRFAIAYVVLLLLKPKFSRFILKDELIFLLLGLSGCSLYFFTENTALTYTLTSNVSIIVAVAPMLTAILAHFFTKDEKIHRNTISGFIIAFLGVALVVFNGTVILKLDPLGDFLALLAAVCWSVYSVILKRVMNRYDSIILIRKVMFYGLITTLPAMLIEGEKFDFIAFSDIKVIFCLVFLGVFGSGLCYLAWNVAIRRLGVITANSYIYINPFVTMICAWLLLDEEITLMGIIGAVLIIFGVVITGRIKKNEKNLQKM